MTAWADAVQVRIGTDRLIQLTNYLSTATTVDTTVLEAACSDAIGEFQRISGITADSNNSSHLGIIVQGSIFFLEDYKGRDGGIMTGHGKRFYSACANMRRTVYISPDSTSTLVPEAEATDAKPDMDRSLNVWSGGKRAAWAPAETLED